MGGGEEEKETLTQRARASSFRACADAPQRHGRDARLPRRDARRPGLPRHDQHAHRGRPVPPGARPRRLPLEPLAAPQAARGARSLPARRGARHHPGLPGPLGRVVGAEARRLLRLHLPHRLRPLPAVLRRRLGPPVPAAAHRVVLQPVRPRRRAVIRRRRPAHRGRGDARADGFLPARCGILSMPALSSLLWL